MNLHVFLKKKIQKKCTVFHKEVQTVKKGIILYRHLLSEPNVKVLFLDMP